MSSQSHLCEKVGCFFCQEMNRLERINNPKKIVLSKYKSEQTYRKLRKQLEKETAKAAS